MAKVKNLMIVESPAKAKTIEKYLGKDFIVKSCYGHIRDLPKKNKAVHTENNYEPEYEIPADKKDIIKELKKLAKDVNEVWLATDEDREGEAISWHLCEVLGLNPEDAKRIVFHEITKPAISKAIENPRHINISLVNAQQARRILDRLVGFEISPILWRKMSMKQSLSAGRVQSVAVRLVVEREREIIHFKSTFSYKVSAIFEIEDKKGSTSQLKAILSDRFPTEEKAEEFLQRCKNAEFAINDIQVKPSKKSPAAPFTTSTLQQEAGRKLSYSVSKTMTLAQRLYEAGLITYMRTDSVNLSDSAKKFANQQIKKLFGDEYAKSRNYKTKSSGAQEAHEAIRPTYFDKQQIDASGDEQRLYDLIWKRTLASQMSEARLEKTNVKIGISTISDSHFKATGEVIKFDGFLKLYIESTDEEHEEEESGLLPPMEKGQQLERKEIEAVQRFSRPPARYTEASLVRKLEELGIGRPSTYAPTISTIQKRGYAVKETREGKERKYNLLILNNGEIKKKNESEITGAEKNKLFPTDVGMLVTDFLNEHFEKIMDYNFTARIEQDFDEIAQGQKEWNKMIDNFYKPFHKNVEETMEKAERVTGERKLGDDPETGKPIIVRLGKYGPMVQKGESGDENDKPEYAKLRPDQKIETITFEEALELFKLPRKLGEFEGEEVQASEGRYGPYIRHKGKFYSIKDKDPFSVNFNEAIEVIKEKREQEKKKVIQEYEKEGIQVLNGPYGPYIKYRNKNYKIPKDKTPEALTVEECQEIIQNAPARKKRKYSKKKK